MDGGDGVGGWEGRGRILAIKVATLENQPFLEEFHCRHCEFRSHRTNQMRSALSSAWEMLPAP